MPSPALSQPVPRNAFEDEDDEDDALDDGAGGRPQPDQVSTKEPCFTVPIAAGADQAKTSQLATPPSGVAVSANLPDPPATPLA